MRGDDTGGCWQVFRKWCEGGDGTVQSVDSNKGIPKVVSSFESEGTNQ